MISSLKCKPEHASMCSISGEAGDKADEYKTEPRAFTTNGSAVPRIATLLNMSEGRRAQPFFMPAYKFMTIIT